MSDGAGDTVYFHGAQATGARTDRRARRSQRRAIGYRAIIPLKFFHREVTSVSGLQIYGPG